MKWIKNHKILVIIVLLLIMLIPMLLNELLFNNDYPSRVSNDGWAGFFGGYIGAIIGAVMTIAAVLIEIKNNERIRFKDELRTIRPYLCIQNCFIQTQHDLTTDLVLTVENVGFHAACDIYLYDGDMDETDPCALYKDHLTLAANNQKEITVSVNLYKSERYKFRYYDIRGDKYEQDLVFEVSYDDPRSIVSFGTLEPKLLLTKEERNEFWSC